MGKRNPRVILAALSGLAGLLTLLVFFAARLAARGDGTQVIFPPSGLETEGMPVKPFVPSPNGLRTDDRITAINGLTTNNLLIASFTGNWSSGALLQQSPLEYTVLRDGRLLLIHVKPGPFPIVQALQDSWSIYLAMLLTALVALFVFIRSPHLPSAQLFFVSCALGAASTVGWTMQHQASDLLRGWVFPFEVFANTALYFLGLSAIVHFLLVFPRRHPLLVRYPRLILLNYLGVWVLAIAYVFLRATAARTPVAFFQLEMESENVSLLYFLVIISVVVSSVRRVQDETERRQLRWIAWGILVGLSAMGILVTLAIALDRPIQNFLPLVGLFLFAIPLSMAIAILRENLFDINFILSRTLVYAPLTAILAGLFAASITLSQRLFVSLSGQQSDAATVLTTLVVVAAVDPVKTGLQKLVDRHFKGASDPLERLNDFGEQLQSILLVFDEVRTARRFLDEAIAAFDAEGGQLELSKDGSGGVSYRKGQLSGTPSLSASLHVDGMDLGKVELSARRIGLKYTERDRAAFEKNAIVVARALALANRTQSALGNDQS